MDEKILWTRRCNVNKLSKEQGILVQENDEVKTLVSMDKTKWCFVRVQPMDEQMFHTSNLWTRKCISQFKLAN